MRRTYVLRVDDISIGTACRTLPKYWLSKSLTDLVRSFNQSSSVCFLGLSINLQHGEASC